MPGTELDLTTSLEEAMRTQRTAPGSRSMLCVVHPETTRKDVCGTVAVHPAEVFIRFSCGCAYMYCRKAVVTIYGPIRLRAGICPVHGYRPIIEGAWLTR